MKLKVLGAAGTVTGSSYILTSQNGQSILIDLGMFQGPEEIQSLNYQPYDYNCSQLSAALLTHAHLDHCGRLPILLPLGFTGKIWMTPATLHLTELTLRDSAKIAERDKKHALYDTDQVEDMLTLCHTLDYHQPMDLGDFQVTFYNPGHLLGAASILIKDKSGNSGINTIAFSGDLGHIPEELLQDREQIESAQAVVIESTYGDRLHEEASAYDALQTEINAIEADNATLLIPAFSLEKTQELLHMILHLKQDGKVSPNTPVFLDSPMAQRATAIYLNHPELFNPHVAKETNQANPFEFPGLETVYRHHDSQAIHAVSGAKVIIAGAGMMTGGRIVSHAAHYLPDPKNRIFFVGYQGEETLGRDILEGKKDFTIKDTSFHVNATVSNTRTMSAHADQGQLLAWLDGIKDVQKVIVTHGDTMPRATLAQKIQSDLGLTNVLLPYQNQEIDL